MLTQPTETQSRFLNTLADYKEVPGSLIPLLQATQELYGYVPQAAIEKICEETGISESEVYGVITFYKQFRLKPVGKHLIRLCDGTACHVNNSKQLIGLIEDELKLKKGEDTTYDGLFTIQPVACLGCCSLAPVIMIGDETFGRLTAQKVKKILKQYKC